MTNDLFSVKDHVIIITGASRGIGRAVAEGFIAAEARAVCVARSSDVSSVVAAATKGRAIAVQCDVSEPGASAQIRDAAVEVFGRIDVLINNAGISNPDRDPYGDDNWDRTMDVNLRAVFQLSRDVADVMKEQGSGSIINLASIAGMLGFPGNPSYQASKGGLRQLTRAMAHDYGPFGVRINSICPGYIRTAMTERSFEVPELRDQRTSRTMLGRWGRPEELVGACIFLASAASSYITGCDLTVDGGWSAKGL